MSKLPYFRFYAKDWRSSPNVRRMNLKEEGIYIRLCALAWDSETPGTITLSDSEICREIRIFSSSLRQFLVKFPTTFQRVGDFLVQPKLQLQHQEFEKFKENKSLAGKRGNAVRWHKDRFAFASALASAFAVQKPKAPVGALDVEMPVWLPEPAWKAYVEMRGAKYPIKPKTALIIFKKLKQWMEQGDDPGEVLEQSVMNGWRGIFPLQRSKGTSNGKSSAEQRSERIRAASERVLGTTGAVGRALRGELRQGADPRNISLLPDRLVGPQSKKPA